jgi:hypothetical protein
MAIYKDHVTFSEALAALKAGDYKAMRFHPEGGIFSGQFMYYDQGCLCTLINGKDYQQVNINSFTYAQLTEPCWHISYIVPEGWSEAYDGSWYKPTKVDVWINVYYNYRTMLLEQVIWNTLSGAERNTRPANDSWTFIKTCHLQQQLSIPWKKVENG